MFKKPVLIEKKEEPVFYIDIEQKIPELPTVTSKEKLDIKYPLIAPYAYAHISWDSTAKELVYAVEEPVLDDKEKKILGVIEDGVRELINITFISVKEGDTLIKFLEKNIKILLNELGISVSKETFLKLMYYVYRDFVGLNEIEPLLWDYFIEDIECNGVKFPLYVVHRKYRNLRTNVQWNDVPKLASFVEKLAQKCGKYISYANPLLDGSLPDGSRVNSTYTTDITSRGPTFCIMDGYLQLTDGSVKNIGKFFDECKNNFYYKEENNNEILHVENVNCCGVDEKNLKHIDSRIKTVIKLAPPDKLVEIKLEDGSEITTTTNHLFHIADDKLKLIEAIDLKYGMFVPVPNKLNVSGCTQRINVYQLLKDFSYIHKICIRGQAIRDIVTNEINNLKNNGIYRSGIASSYGVHNSYFYEIISRGNSISFEILDTICKKQSIDFNKLGNIKVVVYGGGTKGKSKGVDIPKFVDEDLAYLVGAIISDGHLSKNSIDVSAYEEGFRESVKIKLLKKFGMCYLAHEGNRLYVCNTLIPYFLNRVFEVPYGKKARIVKVPQIIFKSGNKVIAAFIRGLFDGNGTCKSGLSYKTYSKDLAYGLSYLLCRLGIYSYIRNDKEEYKLNIPSIYEKAFLEKIGFDSKTKLYDLKVLLSKKYSTSKSWIRHGRIPIKPLLDLLKDLKISKNFVIKKCCVSYNRLTDYDSVSKPFAKAIINLLENELKVKESDRLNYLKWLVNCNQEFVKIKSVRTFKNTEKKAVYDIELEPCKFFIAGNKPMNIFDTVRKFTKEPWSPIKLIQMRTVSPEIMAYLWLLIENEMNVMVVGGTGSGKTTLLNALAFFVPPQARIVSIEDTRELNIEHANWLPSVAREGIGLANIIGQKYGEVSLFDLLKESFRQNPDYVIVGEVRGREAYVLFQGMASGHPSFGTMHADDVNTMIKRLETPPINLSASLVEAMDCVCVMASVRVKDQPVRKVREVVEIMKVTETGAATNIPFYWDPATDNFYFKTESHVFNKISKQTGVPKEKLYQEFKLRALLLANLYKKGIFNYKEVQEAINEYYNSPEMALKKYGIIR